MSFDQKIAYFYDPDVGNYHYGEPVPMMSSYCAAVAMVCRPGAPHEAAPAGTDALSGAQLRSLQADGGGCGL